MIVELSIIISIILFLYLRTWNYCYLIDDPVPRDGYLYEGPRKVDYKFYDKKRSIMSTVTNIGVFLATCLAMYLNFGFWPAILFAVYPLNVFGVAWNTGNYYMTTALFILTAHLTLTIGGMWSAVNATILYAAALNSTINALSYVFIAPLFTPYGFIMVIPLLTFLFGKRFKTGIKNRVKRHEELGLKPKMELVNLINFPKIIAYYIYLNIWPDKIGFFHSWGKQKEFFQKKTLIVSLFVCLSFFVLAFIIDLKMCLWWFLSIAIFTHLQGHIGQFVSERYTVLANIAFCVLVTKFFGYQPLPLSILAALYFCRSLEYIPAWKHNRELFSHSIKAFPACPENYTNLSSYYIERGMHKEAIKPLLCASQLTEGIKFGIWNNLSICCAMERMYEHSLFYAKKAYEEAPSDKKHDINMRILELNEKTRKTKRLIRQLQEV